MTHFPTFFEIYKICIPLHLADIEFAKLNVQIVNRGKRQQELRPTVREHLVPEQRVIDVREARPAKSPSQAAKEVHHKNQGPTVAVHEDFTQAPDVEPKAARVADVNLGDLYAESGQTWKGSFSAVSTPNFANKYALESSRRDLHNALLCTVLQSQNFSQKSRTFFRD